MVPVITAAAPPTALRIKKLRRSTPGGTSRESNSTVSSSGSVTLDLCDRPVGLTVSSNVSFSFSDMVPPRSHLDSDQTRTAATRSQRPRNLPVLCASVPKTRCFAGRVIPNGGTQLPPNQTLCASEERDTVRSNRFLTVTDCLDVRPGVGNEGQISSVEITYRCLARWTTTCKRISASMKSTGR